MMKFNFISKFLSWFGYQSSAAKSTKASDVQKEDSFTADIKSNLARFATKDVENILIPRSEMRCVPLDIDPKDLIQYLKKYLHTRIMVYSENTDNIIGFLHIKDVFKAYKFDDTINIQALMRKVMYVTDNISLSSILKSMQASRTYVSVVLDEYTGVRGIVTIGDVLDELIGPMKDEHTLIHDQIMCDIIDEKTLVLNGKVKLHDLEEVFGIEFDKNLDAETIGGALLFGDVMSQPLVFENKVEFRIKKFDGRAVRYVKVLILNDQITPKYVKQEIDG